MSYVKKFCMAASASATLGLAASAPARAASLSGVWQVAVTLVDCTSCGPVSPAFTSLLAFAGNGTESEATNNPALQPGQRSTAYGIWSKTGTNTYQMDTFALILFAGSGAHPISQGSQQIDQDITLSGASRTSAATIQFFDAAGAPVTGGCATAAATRLM